MAASAQALGGGGDHDPADAHGRVGGGVGEMLEVAAVLVTAGVMGEQVADGVEVEAFERLEPHGTETGHVGERLGDEKAGRFHPAGRQYQTNLLLACVDVVREVAAERFSP